MKQEIKVRKIRPQSARNSSDYGKRSMSFNSNTQKIDIVVAQKLSGNLQTTFLYKDNYRNTHRLGLGLGMTEGIQKYIPRRIDKSPQKLFEQNLILKKKINQLEEQIRKQKTQIESNRKTAIKLRKKMNVQFEKELYWQHNLHMDNNYMILGVKNQYQKLKENYNNKCIQINNLKKIVKYTQLQQTTAQLQAYKAETNRLKSQLDKFIQLYKIPTQINSYDSKINQSLIMDMKRQIANYNKFQQSYENGMKNLNKVLKEKENKIQFLQKLIIEKQNTIFKNQHTIKNLTQQNDHIKHKLNQLKQYVNSITEQQNKKIQQIKLIDQKRYEKQAQLFQKEINQKKAYILKLQKQVGYLSALISQYRKPQQKLNKSGLYAKQKSVSQISKQKLISYKKQATSNSFADFSQHQLLAQNVGEQLNQLITNKSFVVKEESPKHYTFKRNKVKLEDIKQICLQIKYRLLSKSVSVTTAKNLLNNGKEFISIKQIIEKLKQPPFSIGVEQKRILLARYLIEDHTQPIIYYEQQRTSQTVIVLSIFLQVIPKYQVLNTVQLDKVKLKVFDMVTKYKNTLTQAVTQYSKSMIITFNKFIEILEQQELNIGEHYTNFMIIQMLQRSIDINTLQFKGLLDLITA